MAKSFDLLAKLTVNLDQQSLKHALNSAKNIVEQRKDISLNIGSNANQLIGDIQRVKAEANRLQTTGTGLRSGVGINGLGGSLKQYRSELSILNNSTGARMRWWSINLRSLSTLSSGIIGTTTAYRQLRESAQSYFDVQDKLVSLGQITGAKTLGDVSPIENKARSAAIKYGLPTEEILGSAEKLVAAGLSVQDVSENLGLLSKLKLNSQIKDLDSVAKGIVILKQTFGMDTPQIEQSYEKMIQLSKDWAVESQDIIDSLSVVGATSKQMNIPLNDTISMFTILGSKSQASAANVAHAMKTIFSRVGSMPSVQNALQKFGVETFTPQGKLRNMMDIIGDMSKQAQTKGMQSQETLQLLNKVSGARQINFLATLLQSYDEVKDTVDSLKKPFNNLTKDADLAMESLKNRATATKEAFNKLFSDIAGSGQVQGAIRGFLDLSKAMSEAQNSISALVPALSMLGVAYGASKLNIPQIGPAFSKDAYGQVTKNSMLNRMAGFGRPAAGVLGAGMMIGSTNVGNPVGQLALSSASVGLMGFAMGLDKGTAGLLTLVSAVGGLSDAFIQMNKQDLNKKIDAGTSLLGKEINKFGINPRSNKVLEALTQKISLASTEGRRETNPAEAFWRSASGFVTLDFDKALSPYESHREARKKAFKDVLASNDVESTIKMLSEEFLASDIDVNNMNKDAKRFLQLLDYLADFSDDGVKNQSRVMSEVLIEQKKRLKAEKAITGGVEGAGTDQLSKEDYENIKERLKTKITDSFDRQGDLAKAYVNNVSNLGNAIMETIQTRKGFGMNVDTSKMRVDTDKLVKGEAMFLAGADSVKELETRILGLIPQLQTQQNEYGAISLKMQLAGDALSLLADASSRAASALAALQEVENRISAKESFAETLLTGDPNQIAAIQRGANLAREIANGRANIDQMNRQQKQEFLNFTRQIEDLDLGFGKGRDIRQAAIAQSKIGQELGMPNDLKQRKMHQENIVNIQDEAIKAQKAIANISKETLSANGMMIAQQAQMAASILTEAFNNLPTSIQMEATHNVNVNFTQADILRGLDAKIQQIVVDKINATIKTGDSTKPPQMNRAPSANIPASKRLPIVRPPIITK